ncbi:chitin synthase-domain-containing protein [Lactarius sanguifluus]|nr:chitin synthase-domain-containing protein [Lactarius sanguifluus]
MPARSEKPDLFGIADEDASGLASGRSEFPGLPAGPPVATSPRQQTLISSSISYMITDQYNLDQLLFNVVSASVSRPVPGSLADHTPPTNLPPSVVPIRLSPFAVPYQAQSPLPPNHHDPYSIPLFHSMPFRHRSYNRVSPSRKARSSVYSIVTSLPRLCCITNPTPTRSSMVTRMPSWGCGQLAPSARSQEIISLNMPRQYNAPPDEDANNNIYYGRIPQRAPRPQAHRVRVPVHHDEFTHMRYSAATGDPNDFKDNGFTPRQVHYDPLRRLEFFIVITRTTPSSAIGVRLGAKEGWLSYASSAMAGRRSILARCAIVTIGAYQEGIASDLVDGKPVSAHIYEYTTQRMWEIILIRSSPSHSARKVAVTGSNKIEGAEKGIILVQVVFCMKETGSSMPLTLLLQPNVCVLLDVGTGPDPSSIYHLWKALDTGINSNVGGACGEIVAFMGKYGQTLPNPLVAVQNFECKMTNILDKLSTERVQTSSLQTYPVLGSDVQAPSRAAFRLDSTTNGT